MHKLQIKSYKTLIIHYWYSATNYEPSSPGQKVKTIEDGFPLWMYKIMQANKRKNIRHQLHENSCHLEQMSNR